MSVIQEKAKYIYFIYMQPRNMKFTFVQINMKQVSYTQKNNWMIFKFFLHYNIWKNIFKQNIFVSDRTNNMKFSKMQNKIYGPMDSTTPMYQPSLPKVHKQKFNHFRMCVTFQHRGLHHLDMYCTLINEAWLKSSIHFDCRYLEL